MMGYLRYLFSNSQFRRRNISHMKSLLALSKLEDEVVKAAVKTRVKFINRNEDIGRRESFERQMKRVGIMPERVRAITYDKDEFTEKNYIRFVGKKYHRSEQFPPKRICLQLSHSTVWRQVAEGPDDWVLCCEDDALFYGNPAIPVELGLLPNDADLVFVNSRTAEGLLRSQEHSLNGDSPLFAPIQDAAQAIIDNALPYSAPGADAYYLSKMGAGKILKVWEEFKVHSTTDWFLFLNSLDPDYRSKWIQAEGSGWFDEMLVNESPWKAYVMVPPLVDQTGTQTVAGNARADWVPRHDLVNH